MDTPHYGSPSILNDYFYLTPFLLFSSLTQGTAKRDVEFHTTS